MGKQQTNPRGHDKSTVPAGTNVLEKTIVTGMAMGEDTWLRHANPWSVWSRFSCLPLLVFAIWSRDWIGIWALVPVSLAVLWIWWNPRAFSKPDSFDHWPAHATFGERIWLNRKTVEIPKHHDKAAFITSLLAMPGMAIMIYGLVTLALWPTILGMLLTTLAKTWFCDRMVWLYRDMRRINPIYASWSQKPGNDNTTATSL